MLEKRILAGEPDNRRRGVPKAGPGGGSLSEELLLPGGVFLGKGTTVGGERGPTRGPLRYTRPVLKTRGSPVKPFFAERGGSLGGAAVWFSSPF